MKQAILAIIATAGIGVPLALAQIPTPPINNQGNNQNNNQNNNGSSARRPSNNGPSHGKEIPIVDPTNKVVEFQGRKYSLMDNNLGGQFEAFLATDTLSKEEASEYRATLKQILEFLSPNKKKKPRADLAFELLSKAAEYPGDGNICEALVNSLNSARNSKNKVRALYAKSLELDKERKTLIHNMGIIEKQYDLNPTGNTGKGAPPQQRRTGIFSTKYLDYKRRLVEIDLLKKKYETEGLLDVTQAKIHYQAMLMQLFVQRRFEHVIIGCRFYNLVFEDGDEKLRLKKGSQVAKFFTEGLGTPPTVAGLDAAANEAIRKVKTLVNAFKNNIKTKRVHAASERLVEAYVIGEFLPVVQTIPIELKERIQQYIQDANDMVKTLDARDLEKAEKLNESLTEQARDYNESEAKSYINGLKVISRSSVRDANLALFQMKHAKTTEERYNEEQRFKDAMAAAVQAWPSNPDIERLGSKIDNVISSTEAGLDQLKIARDDFDDWKKTGAWAAIFNDKERLGGAFGLSQADEDKERLEELRQIIKNKADIFAVLKEAETLKERGFSESAWEIVHRSQRDNVDDIELSRAMAEYSSSAAKFSNIITKAQQLEEENPASFHSLTWYLKAKTISPDSKYVNEGITRILKAYEKEHGFD